jgi:hypothetical protein
MHDENSSPGARSEAILLALLEDPLLPLLRLATPGRGEPAQAARRRASPQARRLASTVFNQ